MKAQNTDEARLRHYHTIIDNSDITSHAITLCKNWTAETLLIIKYPITTFNNCI
jgi:hypothetical protein